MDGLAAAVEAYVAARPAAGAAALLRAFQVRSYLWPELTDEEAASEVVMSAERREAVVACLVAWIRTRESEDAFRAALAAAERVVVVHGDLDAGAVRALRTLAPPSEAARPPPAKRARVAVCAAEDPVLVPSAAATMAFAERLEADGYVVVEDLVAGAFVDRHAEAIRGRWLPRELSFYPDWRSSDFFHNSSSEPDVPINPDLAFLGDALLPGLERFASAVIGEAATVVQGNATLYSAATNARLAEHRDGSPYSIIVHVSATDPSKAGLELDAGSGFERVLFPKPGQAVLLRGDEFVHRSVPVDDGGERLVLVFFVDLADRARERHPKPPPPAASLACYAVGGSAPADLGTRADDLDAALAEADLVLVVGLDKDAWPTALRAARGRVAEFAAAPAGLGAFAYGGPVARTLGFALGLS